MTRYQLETGDVVEVVLDVVPVEQDGKPYERVYVRGVYPTNAPKPERLPNAVRNIVQTWFGARADTPALLIPTTGWRNETAEDVADGD